MISDALNSFFGLGVLSVVRLLLYSDAFHNAAVAC